VPVKHRLHENRIRAFQIIITITYECIILTGVLKKTWILLEETGIYIK
jgi:hypothetical protein